MSNDNRPTKPASSEVSAFLDQVAKTPVNTSGERGRLIFALDATASREPTWDSACQLQAEMFEETGALGGLSVQLAFYRGFNEFHAGEWCNDTDALLRQMTAVRCLGGHTQLGRVLDHGLRETRSKQVQALIFVGDALEEEADDVCHKAGQLGLLNLPVFVFQEGNSPHVKTVFQQVAKLSGGAWAPFDRSSAKQLRELLSAVAVYAAGGRKALENYSKKTGGDVLRLSRQLK
ncbi:MAG: VWA domain-containing protein [Gammaproteobacteria bacterium]|nr:VWA domain-containing protein [Gammaproteobacteria bacterium]